MSSRAQSESIGVILLTAIAVITTVSAGVYVFDEAQGQATTRADVDVLTTPDGVRLTHQGGEAIPFDALRVVVRNDSRRWEPTAGAGGVVHGNADAAFQPGEVWLTRSPALSSSEPVTVLVVDTRTNSLLVTVEAYPTRREPLTPTA